MIVTAPTLNKKQQELIKLHQMSPTFDLEKALAEFASKPRGRPAQPKVVPPVEAVDTEDSIRREGRFLLEHLENRNVPFVRKTCRGCGQDFLVSYKSSAYCSDSCRSVGFFETYGFVWNPDNSEANRWQYWKVPPSTIRPATLRRLEAFARAILGIEPTEEDLALPTPTIESPVELQQMVNSSKTSSGANIRRNSSPKTSGTSSKNDGEHSPGIDVHAVAAPMATPLMGERLNTVTEIQALYKAGKITAHELQVQLATAFRG